MTIMIDYGRQWKTIVDYQTIYQKITLSC